MLVVENIISPTMQEIIKAQLFSETFPWILLDNITFSEKKGDNLYGLNHTFINKDKSTLPIFPYLLPIVANSVDELGIPYNSNHIEAGRIFVQLPRGESVQNEPHIDTLNPHWVFLYYVNDSDGDTVIFEKLSPWNTKIIYGEHKFKETRRITPKQGTCVIFDGLTYHASCSPTKNKRCIVNFNYRRT